MEYRHDRRSQSARCPRLLLLQCRQSRDPGSVEVLAAVTRHPPHEDQSGIRRRHEHGSKLDRPLAWARVALPSAKGARLFQKALRAWTLCLPIGAIFEAQSSQPHSFFDLEMRFEIPDPVSVGFDRLQLVYVDIF